jgi:hypothetical protein
VSETRLGVDSCLTISISTSCGPAKPKRALRPPRLDAPDDIWAAEQRARAVVACGMCDDDGYRGVYVCDHVDHAPVNERGVALVREALAAAKAKRETK